MRKGVDKNRRRFSERSGFGRDAAPIAIRTDAPDEFRGVLVDLAYEMGLSPSPLRKIACRTFRKRADPDSWSEYPNIDHEVRSMVDRADWYQVYDLVEAIYENLSDEVVNRSRDIRSDSAEAFEREINKYFRREGIGWKLIDGQLEIRGDDSFETVIDQATEGLRDTDRHRSARELREALHDLSRRPDPDVTGSVQHAIAAVECAFRDFTGDDNATLGKLVKRKDFLPPALADALSKLWGFASDQARHIREGDELLYEDAVMVVGLAATFCNYLSARIDRET